MNVPSAKTLENVRLAHEAEQRIANEKEQLRQFVAEQTELQAKKWEEEREQREAEERVKRNAVAKAAEKYRAAQKEEIIGSINNDYPGLSVERRSAINKAVLGSPTRGYIFAGASGGIGKTTLLKALARIANVDGRKVLLTTGMQWESDIRRNASADFADKEIVSVSAEGLRYRRWSCFIGFDEIDKVSKSEFLLNHLHALIDATITGQHQFVITTNLQREEFKAMFGESLWWRLTKAPEPEGRGGLGCVWVEFEDKIGGSAKPPSESTLGESASHQPKNRWQNTGPTDHIKAAEV
jgi:DNA replication protein DnaC